MEKEYREFLDKESTKKSIVSLNRCNQLDALILEQDLISSLHRQLVAVFSGFKVDSFSFCRTRTLYQNMMKN